MQALLPVEHACSGHRSRSLGTLFAARPLFRHNDRPYVARIERCSHHVVCPPGEVAGATLQTAERAALSIPVEPFVQFLNGMIFRRFRSAWKDAELPMWILRVWLVFVCIKASLGGGWQDSDRLC